MLRNLALLGAAAALLATGCRNDNNPVTPADFAGTASTDMAGGGGSTDLAMPGDGGGSKACTTYMTSTIASMRMGTVKGCFELDNVISIGLTPSKNSPRLFVQDSTGGDFSAIQTHCSSTSTTHPCTVAAAVSVIPDGHSVTVKGTYIKSSMTKFEAFYIDSITDNGAGTAPAPATVTLAQVQRNSTANNLAFQKVTTTIAAADTLLMYDWTPSEFVYSGATKCPYQFAFGMIPMSVAGATATASCPAGNASQPPGQTTPNAGEVLIGTDFYSGFKVSSDCRCTTMFGDKQPTATSKLVGTVSGILVYDVPFGATSASAGYFYLAPKADADAPISMTM